MAIKYIYKYSFETMCFHFVLAILSLEARAVRTVGPTRIIQGYISWYIVLVNCDQTVADPGLELTVLRGL